MSQIQAGLSASQDEVTWVQTSYLVAEVIMIPLSGFLSRMLSTRIIFTISAAGFTAMSLMCSTASSIDDMIVWRALQGFIGGGMIPTVFASAYTIFPRSKMPIVAPIIGLVATLAPTIGPTVGGYLTDLFSWHWLFLVNIPPGIMVTVAAWMLIDFDKPDWSLLPRFDWTGLIAMAGFLGAMEYALEEGPSKDWLESQPVAAAIVVSVVSAVVFFWRAFNAPQPIVDMSAFRDRNFWTGCMLSSVMGVGLYGLTYIYPVYLAAVRGYTPLMIGETMFVTGVCMFLTAPISGKLMTKIDPRKMIALGFAGFAFGAYLASKITSDWDFYELLVPQIFRGVSMMLCMVPINNLALGTMPPAMMKNASGIFNLTRNLGGAVGLAIINTDPRQADGPASRAVARIGDLGPQRRRRDDGQHDRDIRRARLGRRDGGDQTNVADGAPSGRGDGARRRVPVDHRDLPRRAVALRADAPPGDGGRGRRRALAASCSRGR